MSKQNLEKSLGVVLLICGMITSISSCSNSLTGTDPGNPAMQDKQERALSATDNPQTHKIKINFNVKNGGMGLWESKGEIISKNGTKYNTGSKIFASNFSISLELPIEDTYVFVQWSGLEIKWFKKHRTYLSAKLDLDYNVDNYNILIDYNGKGKVYTEGLNEVTIW